jgi:uncharacterized protein YgiM (DUF1202 family)
MKLSKPVKTALVVLPFVIGGLLLLKYFRPKKREDNDDNQGNGGGTIPTPTPAPSGFEKHIVTTSTSNLNVRSGPSTSSSIITTLPKGSEIFAKPSATSGWHEYSSDGTTSTGFVSSQYVTKK